ncbi:MAG TPA: hypothetical protein VKA08_16840, partial [Balneolales bacterium]|nr:hypothetical protein [Balneolales bacterium]
MPGSESYQAADSIVASNTAVNSGASLNLSAGRQIILKPGFADSLGSSMDAKIDPGLVGKATEGVSSLTGSNPWQVSVMSYDNEGRVSDKWIWTGNHREWDTHITYAYNWQSQVIQTGVSVDGQTLYQFYDYNQLGQLTAVYISTTTTKPGTAEVTYMYNPTGSVASVNYRGGKGESYAYNIRDWIKTINNVNSTSNFGASYTYQKNGNISDAEYMNP